MNRSTVFSLLFKSIYENGDGHIFTEIPGNLALNFNSWRTVLKSYVLVQNKQSSFGYGRLSVAVIRYQCNSAAFPSMALNLYYKGLCGAYLLYQVHSFLECSKDTHKCVHTRLWRGGGDTHCALCQNCPCTNHNLSERLMRTNCNLNVSGTVQYWGRINPG